MPKDIRSFFGSNPPSSQKSPSTTRQKTDARSSGKPRTSVRDESDVEEDVTALPSRPSPQKKSEPKDKKGSTKCTATATSAYFDKSTTKPTPAKSTTITPAPKLNPSSKKPAKIVVDSVEDFEDIDNDDDIFGKEYKKGGKDDYEEDSDMEVEQVQHKPAPAKGRSKDTQAATRATKETPTPARKRKSDLPDKPAAAAKNAKKNAPQDSDDVKKILDETPLVRPPTPPEKNRDGKFKMDWSKMNKSDKNHTTSSNTCVDLPAGAANCLFGLKFVFTGILNTLDRETGQNLIKEHGGTCQAALSSKTNFVLVGNDAGPKKMETIKKLQIKTINEDGLFHLIRSLPANGGGGVAAQSAKDKADKQQAVAEEKARKIEEEVEKEKRKQLQEATMAAKKAKADPMARAPPKSIENSTKLWTVKYAPTTLDQVVGNKSSVRWLCAWLKDYRQSAKDKFKVARADGHGNYRTVMIYGPPGIGKTTAAHLAAKLEGYDVIESNASDTRSKKMIEDGLRGVLGTTSLFGYFAGDGNKVDDSKKKVVLIMDEVDGMSAGDRGGVGAMAAICRKTQVPIILICNERKIPKMRPFDGVCYEMQFRRPKVDEIKSRIMTIAYREKLKLPPQVLESLIQGTGADIRQVVNMISAIKLDEAAIDFGKSKEMSKAWEKHVVLKPWDITSKILGSAMFDKTSKKTLNDKIELYFNDHELSSLMLQENYLKTTPTLAKGSKLKLLELAEKASESISDGDLVDRMIHGTQQHWSLMPAHAVFSFVRPASFMYGMLGGQISFTSWLGMNSKQTKLIRLVKEIQGHMRLRCSADKYDVRENYVPMFWNKLVKRLSVQGKDAIKDVIELMDSYYLTRDDFDSIMELSIGYMDEKSAKIDGQVKSVFTKTYNGMSHPLPFMKASEVFAPKKQTKERPDLEEANEESDEGEVIDEVKDDKQDEDLSKDKYIKAPKKKAAPKAAAGGGAKGKKRAATSDVIDDDEDDDDGGAAKKAKSTKGKGRTRK